MFDWLRDLVISILETISSGFDGIGTQLSSAIWDTMLQWMYKTVYGAVADFFTYMGNMGAELFDLEWIQAAIRLLRCLDGRCLLRVRLWQFLMWP